MMAPPTGPLLEELIERLADRENAAFRYVIRDVPPARPSTITRASTTSTLGILDALPTELVFKIIGHLDVQSLSRLTRTCLAAKTAVEHLPPYAELMHHVPRTLTALALTRILHHHPVILLHRALRSQKCAACPDFGGHLFLPTCERVCYECLDSNEAFRVSKASFAMDCFALGKEQLARVPVVHSGPHSYRPQQGSRALVQPCRVVSVRQAKRRAIEVHGSAQRAVELTLQRFLALGEPNARYYTLWDACHDVPVEPVLAQRAGKRPRLVERQYGGRAAMRFPCVTGGVADWGIACRGCEVFFYRHEESLHGVGAVESVPAGYRCPERGAQWMRTLLRPWEEHVEHVRGCYAAGLLAEKWENDEVDRR